MATQLFQPPHGSPAWLHAVIQDAQDQPKMHVVDVSPALAKAMLDLNDNNRNIRRSKLAQYTADMAAGKWTLNGEPVIISKDGKLNDGQHRCVACIDANVTVPMMLVFGVDRESRLTVDQGGARSAGDFLGMEGVPNATTVSAIARMAIAYERNEGRALGNSNYVTSAEIRDRVAQDVEIAEAAKFAVSNNHYASRFCPGSIIGFAYYVLSRIHHDEAKSFLERVCRGDGLSIGSPAYTLRQKLLDDSKTRDRRIALILKAWNFHRRGVKRVATSSLNSVLPFPALI